MIKVLLVEDEYIVRKGMQSMVEWEKYGFILVTEASNGKEALDILLGQAVDIVITDVRMPVMDGLELCEKIREHNIDCEIIILSSYDEFQYVKKAMRYSVMDYLHKPMLTTENIIETLLRVSEIRSKNVNQKILKQFMTSFFDESGYLMLERAVAKFVHHETDVCTKSLESQEANDGKLQILLLTYSGTLEKYKTHMLHGYVLEHRKQQSNRDNIVCLQTENGLISVFYSGIGFEAYCSGAIAFAKDKFNDEILFIQKENTQIGELEECYRLLVGKLLQIVSHTKDSVSNPIVEQTLELINTKFSEGITLTDIADIIHVNSSYLSRLLFKTTGKTFFDLTSARRMEAAKEMLIHTNRDIEYISERVGYKNSKYFIKVFKQLVKTTPGNYRRQNKLKKETP